MHNFGLLGCFVGSLTGYALVPGLLRLLHNTKTVAPAFRASFTSLVNPLLISSCTSLPPGKKLHQFVRCAYFVVRAPLWTLLSFFCYSALSLCITDTADDGMRYVYPLDFLPNPTVYCVVLCRPQCTDSCNSFGASFAQFSFCVSDFCAHTIESSSTRERPPDVGPSSTNFTTSDFFWEPRTLPYPKKTGSSSFSTNYPGGQFGYSRARSP